MVHGRLRKRNDPKINHAVAHVYSFALCGNSAAVPHYDDRTFGCSTNAFAANRREQLGMGIAHGPRS
jgi:hypothetical protein